MGKRKLYDWICKQSGVTDAILEGWIPETRQRPDIMFQFNGVQYVIEYQCSPIATEFIERHKLYQACEIKDIWVLGVGNYLNYANNKRNKDRVIETTATIHFDSMNDIILYSNMSAFSNYLCLVDESGFEGVVSSIDKYNFGLLRDKNRYACVRINNLMFYESITPDAAFLDSVNLEYNKMRDEMKHISEFVSDLLFKSVNSRRAKWKYSEDCKELHCKFKLLSQYRTSNIDTLEIDIRRQNNEYEICIFDKYKFRLILCVRGQSVKSLESSLSFLDYQIIECLKDLNYSIRFEKRR